MKKEKGKMARIAGLLSYGTFWSESKKKIMIEYIAIALICLFAIVLAVTMLTIEQFENPDNILGYVFTIIGFVLVFSLLPILLLVFIIKNEKKRKQVELWIEDSIEIEATSNSIGVKRQLGLFDCVKIQVNFEIDGICYSRESDSNIYKKKNFEGGYYYLWSKYADRKVKILYSPKYDQVMILKD